MICVVGMGPGNLEYITDYGRAQIRRATVVMGGKRHLEQLRESGLYQGACYVLEGTMAEHLTYMQEHCHEHVVVVASGDPMVYGIGKMIVAHFPKEQVEVVPGISSVQYLCAAAGIDLNDMYLTSSHGKTPDFNRLLSYPKVAMVTDGHIGPREIAQAIKARGLSKRLIIGERLSYRDERIGEYSVSQVLGMEKFDMNVVVILDEK